jgi:hypothetical protein
MPPTTVPMDPSDPIVALFALVITEALKRMLKPAALKRVGPVIPVVVVVLAMALRVGYDAMLTDGGALTWATVLRGLAAAGVAVLTHTQFRSVAKAFTGEAKPPAEPPTSGA